MLLKRMLLIAVPVVVMLALAGCGGRGTPAPGSGQGGAGAPVPTQPPEGYPLGPATPMPTQPLEGYANGPATPFATLTLPAGYPGGAGAATQPPAAASSITYRNFEIVPATMTVKVGATVTFTSEGGSHQPASLEAPNQFEGPVMAAGDTWTHTFTEAGVTTIICKLHPSMTGSIVVEP